MREPDPQFAQLGDRLGDLTRHEVEAARLRPQRIWRWCHIDDTVLRRGRPASRGGRGLEVVLEPVRQLRRTASPSVSGDAVDRERELAPDHGDERVDEAGAVARAVAQADSARPSGSSSRTGSWRRLVSSGPRAACQRATRARLRPLAGERHVARRRGR